VDSQPVEIHRLSEVQDKMSTSVREMMEIHYDPDVDELVPENWPTSGAPDACGYCRFRGICEAAGSV
jgi:hypothetical protein